MAKINPNIKSKQATRKELNIPDLCRKIRAGDRYALSQAITIIESGTERDEQWALEILDHLAKEKTFSHRIGLSGAPGSGKSTLIDALGVHLIKLGKKPAVLAIDPSSSKTGGSILGDKTRMEQLSKSEDAFIRPSPAGNTLGGVARKTRESIVLLEAAGFDPILIETVGVGQSETMVKSMTDLFILLIAPGAGDEIQGIKRGIMELANIIAINKMDGNLESQARETLNHYRQAISLLSKDDNQPISIMGMSAQTNFGIAELWKRTVEYIDHSKKSGYFVKNRESQNIHWFEDHIREGILEHLLRFPNISAVYQQMKSSLVKGEISPFAASHRFFEVLKLFDSTKK